MASSQKYVCILLPEQLLLFSNQLNKVYNTTSNVLFHTPTHQLFTSCSYTEVLLFKVEQDNIVLGVQRLGCFNDSIDQLRGTDYITNCSIREDSKNTHWTEKSSFKEFVGLTHHSFDQKKKLSS